jgi:hypothetical protein
MITIIFTAVEDWPVEQHELAEETLVKNLIALVAGRHSHIAELFVCGPALK